MKESSKPTNTLSNNAGKKILGLHLGEKKVIIRFEDEKISIRPNTYTELRLFPGKVLSEQDLKEIAKLDELDAYLEYAKKLLAKSLKSESELKEKLAKKGANKSQVKAIIEKLKKYHLVDDKAMMKELLENYNYKCYGKHKIIEHLKQKGIPLETIKTINFKDEDEYKKAKKLLPTLDRKFSKYNFSLKKEHIYHALLRLGFDRDIASKVINEVIPNDYKSELEILKKDYNKVYLRYKRKYPEDEVDHRVIEYLLSKGYRYADINKVKGAK